MATAADSVKTMARGAFPAVGPKIGLIENEISLATVSAELVAQGDGELATGDIIQALSLPLGTCVLSAGIEVTETLVGATAFDVDMGITGGDVDIWVDGIDLGSSGSYVAGEYAAMPAATYAYVMGGGATGASTDTIDILCNTVTGSLTAGKLRVWAVVVDVADMAG
jgi:hypothetical protein